MKHLAKLALLSAFVLRPCNWDAQAEAWSRLLPHDWPGENAGALGRKVRDGKAEALELTVNEQRVGFLVYVIDRAFPLPEMVIQAAYSAVGMFDVTATCEQEICAMAKSLGCATVRCHTMRPALIAKLQGRGWRISEVLLRKDVRHD